MSGQWPVVAIGAECPSMVASAAAIRPNGAVSKASIAIRVRRA